MAHTFSIRKVLTTQLINGIKSCFRVITQELWSGGWTQWQPQALSCFFHLWYWIQRQEQGGGSNKVSPSLSYLLSFWLIDLWSVSSVNSCLVVIAAVATVIWRGEDHGQARWAGVLLYPSSLRLIELQAPILHQHQVNPEESSTAPRAVCSAARTGLLVVPKGWTLSRPFTIP